MATGRSTCGNTLAGSKPFQRPPPLGGYRTPDPPFYFRGSRSPDAPVGGLRHLNFRGGGGGGGDNPHPGGEGVREGGKQGDIG